MAAKLETNGIKVVFCPSDADTTIVKVALDYENRSVRISQTVEIDESYICSTDRNEFLTNYTKKILLLLWLLNWKLTVSKLFSAALAAKLEADGIKVVFCPSDADTTLVKVALDYANRPLNQETEI